jgi:aminoglycoside phosphotransferase family enzyme/predicted kinase
VGLPELLRDLADPRAFPAAGPTVETIQTHVSVVFLTGDRAYKVKKPLALWGLLDYSTPAKRRRACEDEVRLSGRFAPEVYLGVLPVVRRGGRLFVGGQGEVVDHAVEMRRLPPGATLAERVSAGIATPGDVVGVARWLAAAHARADRGPRVARAGRPVVFARILRQNVRATRSAPADTFPPSVLAWLAKRLASLLLPLRPVLAERARRGVLVEGHGDLRAEHMVLWPTPSGPAWRAIDAIEFSEALRSIDPLSDAAFLAMDLAALGRRDLGDAFLAAYAKERPDPDAERLLPLYLAYRAHVRAKVDAHRAGEDEIPAAARADARRSAIRHLTLAWSYARRRERPLLLVLSGAAGTGKSAFARVAAPLLDAEWVQSDVIRKAIARVPTTHRATGDEAKALYGSRISWITYERLHAQAVRRLRAGRSVILDATFLRRSSRKRAIDDALALGAVPVVLRFSIPEEDARARLEARAKAGTDPSDAGIEIHLDQVSKEEPPAASELPYFVDHDGRLPPESALSRVLDVCARAAS